jgi:hypothetical protein
MRPNDMEADDRDLRYYLRIFLLGPRNIAYLFYFVVYLTTQSVSESMRRQVIDDK